MKLKFVLSFLVFLIAIKTVASPPAEEGKAIFTTRCASCHNVNRIIVGPALAGVDQRHDIEWIIRFVQSSQSVIKSGDPAATVLFTKFNSIQMPNHPDLTADNIKSIVDFIKTEAKLGGDKAPFARPSELQVAYIPLSINNYGFFIGFFVAVVLMIWALVAFVKVKEYERNHG